jgi:GH25 family lysozyme M1 (1,4-beta-N-acetylmuramidase)
MTGSPPFDYSRAVFGTDVSHHQTEFGDSGAAALYNAGIRFCWAKATEGGDFNDKRVQKHISDLSRHGIPCGVYHFARPDLRTDPTPEIDHFARRIEQLGADAQRLRPCIDIETPSSSKPRLPHGVDFLAKFINGLTDKTGVVPVVYVGYFWWLRHLAGVDWRATFGSTPLWMPRYPDDADGVEIVSTQTDALQSKRARALPYPKGATLNVWQYSGQGRVPGYSKRLDLNVTDPSSFEPCVWPGATVAVSETSGPSGGAVLAGAAVAATLAATLRG